MDNYLFIPRALAAALYDASFAAAFGMVLAELWIGRDAEPALRARLRRASIFCAFTMLLALCAQTYLTTATMIASSAFNEVSAQLASVLFNTHAGRSILVTFTVLLVSLPALALQPRTKSSTPAWITLALLMALAAARAASGHAASDGDFNLRELVQWVHLVSIAVWSGGVMVAAFAAYPGLLRAHAQVTALLFLRRLSSTVTIALALVILTGIYNAYHGLSGSLTPLRNTQWGLLLDAKSLLVLVAVALGALNRRLLHTKPPPTNRLAALLRAEAIVMVLILIVSAFLANSPPADMAM